MMMSGYSSASFPYSYKRVEGEEEYVANPIERQSCTIRRTFSADMSSPKWLQSNGLNISISTSNMKRAESSERLQGVGEEDFVNGEEKRGAFEDIWCSILSTKMVNDRSGFGSKTGAGEIESPPPYVHPLVKRSASSLSEKSLEICTESLGSETGSDGFSFPPSFQTDEDSDSEPEDHKNTANYNVVEEIVNDQYKKVNPKPIRSRTSFPPPLPSLTHRGGSNLHMRSHRRGGRLVLEAVAVPAQTCFQAHRHDGRLFLTLTREQEGDDVIGVEEDDDVQQKLEDCDEDGEEKKSSLPNEVTNMHRYPPLPSLIMSKIINTRDNSTWHRSINTTVISNLDDKYCTKVGRLIQSDKPTNTATAVNNSYEYYWRQRTAVAVLNPLVGQKNLSIISAASAPQVGKDSNKNKLLLKHNRKSALQQQEVVVVKTVASTGEREKETTEYLVPLLRGCKHHRRPRLCWEPPCIATT